MFFMVKLISNIKTQIYSDIIYYSCIILFEVTYLS